MIYKEAFAMKKVLLMLAVCLCFGVCTTAFAEEESKELTRSEFCTQVYTIVKYTDCMGNVEITKSFDDCDDKAVNEMCTMGVAFGKGDGNFHPDDKITRQEAIAIYGRLCKYMNLPANLSEYAYADDGAISDWAKEDVYIAYHAGILEDSENINPLEGITADEVDEISKAFYTACTGETYPPKNN